MRVRSSFALTSLGASAWLAVISCGSDRTAPPRTDVDAGGAGAGGAESSALAGMLSAGGRGGHRSRDLSLELAGAGGEAALSAELLETLITTECEYFERCEGAPSRSAASCAERVRAELRARDIREIRLALALGTAHYDPSALRECIAAFRAAPCAMLEQPTECLALLDGTLALGDECVSSFECAGSARCGRSCPRTCVEPYALHEACALSEDCAAGLYCGKESKTCVAHALEGESCGNDVHCAPELFCASTRCEPYAREPAGARCSRARGVLCEDGAACVVIAGSAAQGWEEQCVPIAEPGGKCRIGTRPQACVARGESLDDCRSGAEDSCPGGERCPLGYNDHALAHFETQCVPNSPHLDGFDCECQSKLCSNGICTQRLDCAEAAPAIEPGGACPTQAATGELLEGFDSADAIQAWRPAPDEWSLSASAIAEATLGYSEDEGLACAGALKLTFPFAAYGSTGIVSVAFGAPTGTLTEDWSARRALRASIRVADPGTRNFDYLEEITFYVSTLSADGLRTRAGLSRPFSRFSNTLWHDFRVTFDRSASWERVTGYGVALKVRSSAPLGGPAVPPPTTLYVDDVVLE